MMFPIPRDLYFFIADSIGLDTCDIRRNVTDIMINVYLYDLINYNIDCSKLFISGIILSGISNSSSFNEIVIVIFCT